MKRLNNKGFAISTVIYGLSVMSILIMAIIMGTMANSRANTKELSKSIERDLNNFSRTEVVFSAKDGPQAYIVPDDQSGWYKIELWGAQGGTDGGLGAYTSGIIELQENDMLYFNIGKAGNEKNGGGSTDVRIEEDEDTSLNTRIMVAGGGGISPNADGGTLVGYTPTMKSIGGYINSYANGDYSLFDQNIGDNPTNGTLIGYPKEYEENNMPQAGDVFTSNRGSDGGGDGYFPGTSADMGGSSFISGYAGCKAINSQGVLTDSPKYKYSENVVDASGNNVTNTLDRYYFVDGMMLPGVNSGDGYAKVERIAIKDEKREILERKNSKLNNVRKIKDCVDDTTAPKDNNKWKISAIAKGDDLANKGTLSFDTPGSNQLCRELDLGGESYNLDEIATFHGAGVDYNNHTIQVQVQEQGGTTWKTIKGTGTALNESGNTVPIPLSETETSTGFHISAYQYDSTDKIPALGNYYLLPVLSENKVITAIDKDDRSVNPVQINYLQGKRVQKWSIEEINNPNISDADTVEYKIVELSGYKALEIQKDENIINNTITATTLFNKYTRNPPQIWKIAAVGNGTYIITTVVPSFNSTRVTGNIVPQTNISNTTGQAEGGIPQIVIGRINGTTERFRLISVDYSTRMK